MIKPNFTEEEKSTIHYFRSNESASLRPLIGTDLTNLMLVAFPLLFGLYVNELVFSSIAALVILLWITVANILKLKKALRLYKNIFQKYDEALSSHSPEDQSS